MRNPLVSVIVATKNESHHLSRLLKSVKHQKYQNIEIIVVDNFSTDGSQKLANKYTPSVYAHGYERSAQRNFGAHKSRGKYLLFLDADMELARGVIDEAVALCLGQENKIIVAIDEKGIGKTFWGKALALEKECYRHQLTLIHAARFFPKAAFLSLGGYDEALIAAEDWDLTQRFITSGYTTRITQHSFLTHFESSETLSTLLRKETYYISTINTYAKKHPQAFARQQNLTYRLNLYRASWKKLVKDLPHAIGLGIYKFLVWVLWVFQSRAKASK